MTNKEAEKFEDTLLIRKINIYCNIFFVFLMSIEPFIGMYFLIYFFMWVYILFLILETRFIIKTKIGLFEYFKNNIIATIGFITPIVVFFIMHLVNN